MASQTTNSDTVEHWLATANVVDLDVTPNLKKKLDIEKNATFAKNKI